VEGVDILVENHSPAEVEALGVTYDELRHVNPGLIMVSISPFGQTGPYRDYVGSELVLFQMGGVGYETPLMSVTDPETQPPLKGPGYQAYMVAGWMAAATTTIGLYHREVFGEGQHIDVSVHEAMASMVRPNVARFSYAHEVPKRESSGFLRRMPCKDGYMTGLGVGQNEDAWRRICDLMDNPEWTKEEIFAKQESRTEHVEEASAHIIEWMSNYTMAELFEMTQSRGIGAFPLNTVADVFHSDQLEHRGFFTSLDHPVAGQWLYPGTAYLFTDQQPRVQSRAPLLGEHNAEVYCGELGYTPEELIQLHHGGVV
jgi:crotonobetainyl-CoA:carnitine CoA-transferase CaiB-like acyl-CoA transferase